MLAHPALCFLCFFSSRRRHTSFSRDWSSDVCSSDLVLEVERAGLPYSSTEKSSGWTWSRKSRNFSTSSCWATSTTSTPAVATTSAEHKIGRASCREIAEEIGGAFLDKSSNRPIEMNE